MPDQLTIAWEPAAPKVFSVTELNIAIGGLLEREFGAVRVAGEISGTKLSAAGHYYFTLKDQGGQLRCVAFKGAARYLKFKPQDGAAVQAHGTLSVYEPRGEYQLVVDALEPQGHGALQFAFEQLKKKLAAEGLFDAARKRPLPALPRRIGLVTSPTGAVIRDMLHVLERRFPGLHIRLYAAQVQGAGSVEAVCEGIDYFSSSGWAEVVIVARGGGSLEDLWTFNEEAVARAIAACGVPVISAVGHETDFTIADFVADLRAPTPSAAAELVIRTREELLGQIARAAERMRRALQYRLSDAHRRLQQQGIERATALLQRRVGRHMQHLDELDYSAREQIRNALRGRQWRAMKAGLRLRQLDLRLRVAAALRRLEAARVQAARSMAARIVLAQRRLEPLAAQLVELSPLKILDRGYAIVQDKSGRIVKDAGAVKLRSLLHVRLAKGELKATVKESIPQAPETTGP